MVSWSLSDCNQYNHYTFVAHISTRAWAESIKNILWSFIASQQPNIVCVKISFRLLLIYDRGICICTQINVKLWEKCNIRCFDCWYMYLFYKNILYQAHSTFTCWFDSLLTHPHSPYTINKTLLQHTFVPIYCVSNAIICIMIWSNQNHIPYSLLVRIHVTKSKVIFFSNVEWSTDKIHNELAFMMRLQLKS